LHLAAASLEMMQSRRYAGLLSTDFSFSGSLGSEMWGPEVFKDYVRSVRGALRALSLRDSAEHRAR
jgi:hypothetical protein